MDRPFGRAGIIFPPLCMPSRRKKLIPFLDRSEVGAADVARGAGLRYLSDQDPGITREKFRSGFRYRDASGKRLTESAVLGRIRALAIPPAWSRVWICPLPNGHIQATGRDLRGRKQYRYHPDWRSARDETKYERMIAFGKMLPVIRSRVARDLRAPGLGRTKVLATLVRLLETTLIRIGNEEYARENRSFGLSTMRDQHVSVERGTIHFEFRGKSGRRHGVDLHDPRLAKIVRQTQDLPGQELFQYLDESGVRHAITSEDVNAYLREIAGTEFSAKDFRTWAGTVLAALALREFERFDSQAQAKKNLLQAIEQVAQRLGNTPAVCRKCYVHPVVMSSYLDGATVELLQRAAERTLRHDLPGLGAEEGAVLAFLQKQLARSKPLPLATALKRSLGRNRRRAA